MDEIDVAGLRIAYERAGEGAPPLPLPAGGAGSLPAEVVEQRLQQWLREADLPPTRWVPGWIPSLLTEAAPAGLIDEVVAIMSDVRPAGYRGMAYALAGGELRDV